MLKTNSFNDIINLVYANTKIDTFQNLCPIITFQVTENCNLKCSYCYQINKSTKEMSLDIAKKFIDLLIQNNIQIQKYINTEQTKGVVLEFIGGEPLLKITLIDEIITYFRQQTILKNHPWKNNWRISISTNGTLYFDSKVQDFIKKYNNFLSLSISIDGNKELHDSCRVFSDGKGSYDLAIAAARHYKQYFNNNLGSKMTLSPINISQTFNGVINLINEHYNEIYLNCIYEEGWDNSHATILYYELKKIANYLLKNELDDKIYISIFEENFFHPKTKKEKDNWCGANSSMLALDACGNIYPCIRFMPSSLGNEIEPIILGNINQGILMDNKCIECFKKLQNIDRLNISSNECINCPIAEGCSWCIAYNYQKFKDFNHRATYICCMHKARSLGNAYFWNLYYKKHNINKKFEIYLSDNEILKIINQDELNMLKNIK